MCKNNKPQNSAYNTPRDPENAPAASPYTRTLQSLLYELGNLSNLRYIFPEHLYIPAYDGLEHSHVVCIFLVRITIQVLHVQGVHSFISSFGGVERAEE